MKGQTKHYLKISIGKNQNKDPGALELGLGKGSGQAQPEKETWVHPHVGSPLTGGAMEVWCNVDEVAVKGRRSLGGPIPGC